MSLVGSRFSSHGTCTKTINAEIQDTELNRSKSENVGFYIDEGFPMLSLAGMTDVLRMANYFSGQKIYTWQTVAKSTVHHTSASGLRLAPDLDVTSDKKFDRIVVVSEASFDFDDPEVVNWLRKNERLGAAIGAVATGTWILAKAGLLDGKICTINPMHSDAFRETYPSIHLTGHLFEIDARIFTCAGGTSAIDMFLSFLIATHGAELAFLVADSFLHEKIRPTQTDGSAIRSSSGYLREEVRNVLRRMEETIETPVPIAELAENAGVSERHLTRLFRDSLGQSPARQYKSIRLARADRLLRMTRLSIAEIGAACGYGSASRFSTAYRTHFGTSPRSRRDVINPVR